MPNVLRRTRVCCGAVASVLLAALPANAIEFVEPVHWGFDGKIVVNRFNPLSVELRNNTPNPFDGEVVLWKVGGGAGRVGEKIEEPVYVAPFTSRRVQLYPLVRSDDDEWSLGLQVGRRVLHRVILDKPAAGNPATVFLAPADRLRSGVAGVLRLEEQLFPPLVTATDGLEAVLLAHTPQWDAARQQAFADWLRRGGTVHLLHDSRGKFPAFAGPLELLNANADAASLGNGRIVRHEINPGQVDEKFLKASVLGPPRPKPEQNLNAYQYGGNPGYSRWNGVLDEGFIQHLKDMTKPDHNWVLIYFLSVLYLLLFPGVYLLGRKRWHFGMVYAALLAGVALFSLGFHQVGRRGYGEATAVHSIALARPAGDGVYDVTQWSHLFVTDGGEYTVTHKAGSLLYSTAQSLEQVDGVVKNGPGAMFRVDVPPFSGRGFVHRMKIDGPKFTAKLLTRLPPPKPPAVAAPAPVQPATPDPANGMPMVAPMTPVAEVPFTSDLNELEVRFEGAVPQIRDSVYALYRNGVYRLRSEGNTWKLEGSGESLSGFFQSQEFHNYSNSDFYLGYAARTNLQPEELFRQLFRPVMQHSLQADALNQLPAYVHPEDRVRLFLVSEMPPSFFVDNPLLGKQKGYVVYAIDVREGSVTSTDKRK